MITYRMKYRPPGFGSLPNNLFWEYVELPPDHPNPHHFLNLPRSSWRFGVFKTDRPLTAHELRDFEIEVVEIDNG